MRKYKWASIGIFILALLCIVALHSYFNLVERIAPPSDMWGRDNLIGVTTFKREPITAYDGTDVNVIYAQEQNFKRAIIDNNGIIKGTDTFKVNGYNPEKLMSYQGNSKTMLMLENFNLYNVDIEAHKDAYDRQKLLSNILGFTYLDSGDSSYIAAYDKDTVTLYQLNDGILSKLSDALPAKDILYIELKKDADGIFHLAYMNETNQLEYNLVYQVFDPSSKRWVPKMKPYIVENFSSYTLNNLQMCFDDEDVYFFYELYKTSPKGLVAQTFMGRLPQSSGAESELTFSAINLEDKLNEGASYISSLKCINEKGNMVQAIMTTPVKSSLKKEGNELMYAVIDKGKVVEKHLASNTGQWNVEVKINKCGNQYFAFFLQTMGKSQYEIRMTSSGEQYKQAANAITRKDVNEAVRDTISGYIFALFPIFIGFVVLLPTLFWPIAVEFFEWRKFYYNQDLTFKIGVAIEAVFMYINMNMIYRNVDALQYMPDILKFPGAKYFYLALTFAIAYLVTHLFKKGTKDIHMLAQMHVFIFAHLFLVFFLFAKYIAGF